MIRTLSKIKVQYSTDIPVYIVSEDEKKFKHFVDFSTKQILQKEKKTGSSRENYIKRGIITEDSDIYIVKNKSITFISKFISQKYKVKMKYITFTLCMENHDGIWYRRIEKVKIKMPTHYKREWRLRQLLDKQIK